MNRRDPRAKTSAGAKITASTVMSRESSIYNSGAIYPRVPTHLVTYPSLLLTENPKSHSFICRVSSQ